ncbi:hypothetical protein ES703_114079 [subsurface metagenome]
MVSLSLTANERNLLVATLEVILARPADTRTMEGQLFARTSKSALETIVRKLNDAR